MTTFASPLSVRPIAAQDLPAITTPQWQAVLAAEPAQAAGWMAAAAQLGRVEAQAVLGQWHLDGHGVARDPAQALHWFLRAAHRGHAMAMNMAGRCHEQGWGTPADAGKAVHWYRQAVRLELPEAKYNLANMLASGGGGVDGIRRDHAEAFALYKQATEQGYAKAFAKLGRYFEDGQIVAQNADEALRCYRRGAEGGDFRGQFCYAGMLAAQGREAQALQWLAKVPETATKRYLKQAGALLLESPHAAFRAIGERMLAQAGV